MKLGSICVFCGSNPGNEPGFVEAAETLGNLLADREIRLVFGGGAVGLMGKIADTVIGRGGKVLGVIPEALARKEVQHLGLTELRVVGSMHERKAMMAEEADGFIAMPGGFGTFEEVCEIITWIQLGFISKPCGILNVNGYYSNLVAMFDKAVDSGFVRPEHRDLVRVGDTPNTLLELLEEFIPPKLDKWIEKDGI
ncbi:MAG: TIGR00730 family Rossman fold protein [Pyrinomonadaceae bacterium]